MRKKNHFSLGSFFARIISSYCYWFANGSKLDDVSIYHRSRKLVVDRQRILRKQLTAISKKKPLPVNKRNQIDYFGRTVAKKLKSKKLANGRKSTKA